MNRKFTHKVIAFITNVTVAGIGTLAIAGILYSIFLLITEPTFRV